MDDKIALPNLARENLNEEASRLPRNPIYSRQLAFGEQLALPSYEHQLGIDRRPLEAASDGLSGALGCFLVESKYPGYPGSRTLLDRVQLRQTGEQSARWSQKKYVRR
jgi:hypothetical protein